MSGLGFLSLLVALPLPLVEPITSQLLGIWAKSKISRTSLVHSLLYKEHKESADQHKHGWGHWAETEQKASMDVFLSYRREKGKQSRVSVFWFQWNLVQQDMALVKSQYVP